MAWLLLTNGSPFELEDSVDAVDAAVVGAVENSWLQTEGLTLRGGRSFNAYVEHIVAVWAEADG